MLALPAESFEARRVEQRASKQSDCSLTGGSTRNRIARLHAQRWAICGQRGRGHGAVAFLGSGARQDPTCLARHGAMCGGVLWECGNAARIKALREG